MKNPFIKRISIPLALLLIIILSYGLLIPWLGFYWDDWVYTWFGYVLGPGGYTRAFANDRPFLSLIYRTTTSLLGHHPVSWQLAGLFSRWVLVLLFHWFLRLVWPHDKYTQPVFLASALFAIYPGFSQHPISVIYSQAYILFSFFMISLISMVFAVRSAKNYWIYTILSVVCALLCHLSTEYFFGLEFIRPFFIWLLYPGNIRTFDRQLKFSLKHWSPYLAISLGYVAFRYLQTKSPAYEGYEFSLLDGQSSGFFQAIPGLFQEIVSTILKAGITAWTQAAQLFSFPLEAKSTWTYFGLMGFGFIFFLILMALLSRETEKTEDLEQDHWGIFSMGTGLCAILLGRVPSWIAGLPFDLDFPYDRFMLSTAFGSALFITGLVIYFIKSGRRRFIIAAIILSSAIGWNFYTSNTFRRDWQNQTEFFKQLTWRIPGIAPGTIVMTHELPLKYYSDNSLTAPLNWIYNPEFNGTDGRMPYIMVYTKIRLGQSLESLSPGQPVHFNFRAFDFSGSTSDTISIFYPVDGCLRVLDEEFTNQDTLPELPAWYENLIGLTDLTRIVPENGEQASLPSDIFPVYSQEDWCYYFEKAELARQSGDYKSVVNLMDAAEKKGFKPKKSSEYLVFIEGYAAEGLLDTAEKISDFVYNSEPQLTNGLCQVWKRVDSKQNNPGVSSEINRITNEMGCYSDKQ